MASALPIILLAGAAIMLMGRGGDDGDDGGDGDGDGDGKLPLKGAVLGARVKYSLLDSSDKYGTTPDLPESEKPTGLGTKGNPIKYTGSVTILDAPSAGINATGTRFRQEFRVGDGSNQWMDIEDLVSVTTEAAPLWKVDENVEVIYDNNGDPVFDEDARRTLTVKNKAATAPGLFSVKWHKGWAGDPNNSGTLWFEGEGEGE